MNVFSKALSAERNRFMKLLAFLSCLWSVTEIAPQKRVQCQNKLLTILLTLLALVMSHSAGAETGETRVQTYDFATDVAVGAAFFLVLIVGVILIVMWIKIPFVLKQLVNEVRRANDTLDLLLHVTRSNHARQQNADEENERA